MRSCVSSNKERGFAPNMVVGGKLSPRKVAGKLTPHDFRGRLRVRLRRRRLFHGIDQVVRRRKVARPPTNERQSEQSGIAILELGNALLNLDYGWYPEFWRASFDERQRFPCIVVTRARRARAI